MFRATEFSSGPIIFFACGWVVIPRPPVHIHTLELKPPSPVRKILKLNLGKKHIIGRHIGKRQEFQVWHGTVDRASVKYWMKILVQRFN